MSDEFLKTLLATKVPRVHTEEHQKKLKKALLNQACFSQSQPNRMGQRFGLFSYLKNMSFKKIIPAMLVVALLLGIGAQNYRAFQNTAYAQELIDQTLEQVKNAPPQTEEGKVLLSDLELLQIMKENGELIYLGEVIYPSTHTADSEKTRVQTFRLQGKDLSSDILIQITNQKEVFILLENPQMISNTFELIVDDEGNILNAEVLKNKIKDPNLNTPWLKELVKRNNSEFLNGLIHTSFKNTDFADSYDNRKLDSIGKNTTAQLEDIFQSATVMITGFGGGYEPSTQTATFKIDLFQIAGQEKRNSEAQAKVQEIIDWLKPFDTESASTKIKILEKALSSNHLKYNSNASPDILLSFPYPGAGKNNEELNIRLPEGSLEEKDLIITFKSEALVVVPELGGQWVDVWIKEGRIVNLSELEKKLHDAKLTDPLLQFIILNQNLALLNSIKTYETDNANLTPQVLSQLESLFKQSNVPIIDRSMFVMKNEETVNLTSPENNAGTLLFSLGIYPLGQPEKTDAIKVLDEIMTQMKSSLDQEKEPKIKFLQQAQQAKDLKYEGQVTLKNGEKAEKISFTQNGQKVDVIFGGEGEYEVVE